jgi:hypothetical protein
VILGVGAMITVQVTNPDWSPYRVFLAAWGWSPLVIAGVFTFLAWGDDE